jgi:antitoxin component YwqK of YwqJK toxin-antitoxin module
MYLRIFSIASLLTISILATGQIETDLNKTDQQGRKQGHWIKKYANDCIMYDAYFRDGHPIGEFKRYYEDKTLKSLLIFNDNGREVVASVFHPNGYIASKGKYVNQKKEGKWQFFSVSINGYLICEENYTGNLKNGQSLKFFPDSTIAERINYINNIRQGEWIEYYPNGAICLKSNYLNNKINGKFEVWFESGQIEFSGQYNNDSRDGLWLIYSKEGKIKYKLEYKDGVARDSRMDIDESDYIDSLENNKDRIADPEKTGVIW